MIRQAEQLAVEAAGKKAAADSVAIISVFAEAHRVMEDGEQHDKQGIGAHLSGEVQPVRCYAPPMTLAVNGRAARRRENADGIEHGLQIRLDVHRATRAQPSVARPSARFASSFRRSIRFHHSDSAA